MSNPTKPSPNASQRPDFVGGSWLRYDRGFTFEHDPPEDLAADENLQHPNEWMRLLAIFAQAQAGDFTNVASLLELASHGADDHLRDCAARIFGHAAPEDIRVGLAELFFHPDHDTKLEAFNAAVYAADLRLIPALLNARRRSKGFERERIMDHLSDILEEEVGEDIIDDTGRSSDDEYDRMIQQRVFETRGRYGNVAIFKGRPLSLARLLEIIEDECNSPDVEESGGDIATYLAFIEAMTGMPTVGMFDEDVVPVVDLIMSAIQDLRLSGVTAEYDEGKRYFFGHLVP